MDLFYNPLFPLADGMESVPDRPGCTCADGCGDNCPPPEHGGSPDGEHENGGMPDNGNRPAQDSIDPALLSLAMGFVPRQTWETPYELDVALTRGTIFPGLDKPFLGEPPLAPQPRSRMGGF